MSTTEQRDISFHDETDDDLLIDEYGHVRSPEELKRARQMNNLCFQCGRVTTHQRNKVGIRRPLTKEGEVIKGYCLKCHDVQLDDKGNVSNATRRSTIKNKNITTASSSSSSFGRIRFQQQQQQDSTTNERNDGKSNPVELVNTSATKTAAISENLKDPKSYETLDEDDYSNNNEDERKSLKGIDYGANNSPPRLKDDANYKTDDDEVKKNNVVSSSIMTSAIVTTTTNTTDAKADERNDNLNDDEKDEKIKALAKAAAAAAAISSSPATTTTTVSCKEKTNDDESEKNNTIAINAEVVAKTATTSYGPAAINPGAISVAGMKQKSSEANQSSSLSSNHPTVYQSFYGATKDDEFNDADETTAITTTMEGDPLIPNATLVTDESLLSPEINQLVNEFNDLKNLIENQNHRTVNNRDASSVPPNNLESDKKSNKMYYIVVLIVIVIIAAMTTTVAIIMTQKNKQQPQADTPAVAPILTTIISHSPSTTINPTQTPSTTLRPTLTITPSYHPTSICGSSGCTNISFRTSIDSKFCLQIPPTGDSASNTNTDEGKMLQMWTCDGSSEQRWTIDSYGRIRNHHQQQQQQQQQAVDNCIELKGSLIQISSCRENYVPQRWFVTLRGEIRSVFENDKCLAIFGGQWLYTAEIHIQDCAAAAEDDGGGGALGQKWIFSPSMEPTI